MAKIVKSILNFFKKLNSKIKDRFTKDLSKDKNTEISDDYLPYDDFLGITKKSLKLSRKINGEIAQWPTSELQKYSHSKSARKAAEEGKNLFYQM